MMTDSEKLKRIQTVMDRLATSGVRNAKIANLAIRLGQALDEIEDILKMD